MVDLDINLIVPPGEGVFTIHTASEKRAKLQKGLYGEISNREDLLKAWRDSLQALSKSKFNSPVLFGICSDSGAGIVRGSNWGPLFIRQKMLETGMYQSGEFLDIGDIKVVPHLLHDKYLNEETIRSVREALYTESMPSDFAEPNPDRPVSPLSIAEELSSSLFIQGRKVLAFGGDHSVSYPLVKSWLKARGRKSRKLVLHFDAHTDLLDKRLGIDYCFGSWAYHILGDLESSQDLIQVGIRSSGQTKSYWEKLYGIQQFWAEDVLENPGPTIKTICEYVERNKIEEVYISFDIDCLDIKYASATGTPEPGGLSPDFCVQLMTEIGQRSNVTACDLVEVAPFIKNPEDLSVVGQEVTLQSAVAIVRNMIELMVC